MYAQQSLQDTLFLMLYGGVAFLALASGLYLWLRRSPFYAFDLTTYWQLAVMVTFILYYIYVLIRYGRWLRENYADHFMRLYRYSIKSDSPAVATQLAQKSGFRSYSTFATAFKYFNGLTVTAWMKTQV